MLGLVRKKFPYSPAYAVKADTEFDHKVPISAEDWARLRCAEFGLDLAVVRNSNELIADLEREMNFTMRPGASLVQIVEAYSSTQNEQARQQSLCF